MDNQNLQSIRHLPRELLEKLVTCPDAASPVQATLRLLIDQAETIGVATFVRRLELLGRPDDFKLHAFIRSLYRQLGLQMPVGRNLLYLKRLVPFHRETTFELYRFLFDARSYSDLTMLAKQDLRRGLYLPRAAHILTSAAYHVRDGALACLLGRLNLIFSPHDNLANVNYSGALLLARDWPKLEKHLGQQSGIVANRRLTVAKTVLDTGKRHLFLRIPKTASTSTSRVTNSFAVDISHRAIEYESTPDCDYYDLVGPCNLVLPLDASDRFRIFSNIRNPFSLCRSLFNQLSSHVFYKTHLPRGRLIAESDFPMFFREVVSSDKPWMSRRFIFAPFFERTTGALIVDWINRTEEIESDLEAMCHHEGFEYTPPGHANRRSSGNWRDQFTVEMIETGCMVWKREFSLFGFMPDGSYSIDALLHRDTSAMKERLTYNWETDELHLDGQLFTG